MGNPTSELAVINVEHGKRLVHTSLLPTQYLNCYRYRFRLVNMACDPNYNFTIDNHSFTVIEADGENTQPTKADSLAIFAGQRYSIVVRPLLNEP